ncbi:MAG: STAS domain-containing protein [Acidobacteriaceae bacterium]|nr:STAS domain-containing protein [Acidobacteriaceae bacterium]
MAIPIRAVTIRELPEKINLRQGRLFFRQLQKSMDGDRPRIVLDCSKLAGCDKRTLLLLLRCLEEAMKRNGDLKLAGLSPAAKTLLELTGAKRLFEIFDTPAEAVDSFHLLAGGTVSPVSPVFLCEDSQPGSENAA